MAKNCPRKRSADESTQAHFKENIMALDIAEPRFRIKGLNEERQFTNPHVRFRRIRGRIVPIINKKRIGQDISNTSEKLAVGGAVAGATTYYAKKSKDSKRLRKFVSPVTNKIPKFKIKTGLFDIKHGNGFRLRTIKRTAKLFGKGAKFGMKYSGRLGLAAFAIGTAGKIVGDELQARSAFGKDFFFTKDRQGR